MPKIIVITGAGLGLARAGAAVRRRGGAAGLGALAVAIGCDVAQPDAVRAAFARIADMFGRIDVLINNAAVYEPYRFAESDPRRVSVMIEAEARILTLAIVDARQRRRGGGGG